MDNCIVVVEDEPEVLAVLRDLLELEDFKVVGFARPDLALSVLGTVTPDLFLIDIMLPGMSGIELAERLRAGGYSHTPMIAMSASGLMSRFAAESGYFQEAIDKPFDVDALLKCVERYLEKARNGRT
jgi:CheY-like chemotaxis protein